MIGARTYEVRDRRTRKVISKHKTLDEAFRMMQAQVCRDIKAGEFAPGRYELYMVAKLVPPYMAKREDDDG